MKSARPRWMTTSIILTTFITVICLAVIGFMFVTASANARDATGDQVFAQTIFGLPILEGFRLNGKFGVHMKPGAIVFIAIPLLTGVLTSLPALKGFVNGAR
ncbi:hypothetical protein ACIPWF_10650 [Paenarthrobacter sp. NPDC089989]|uniref:hypothetical protein n=1 Tax=unclassified Paenarthrobacter TaxID=2634190 RepID=UPI0038056103